MKNRIISILVCSIFPMLIFGQNPIDLGDRREIFVDSFLIEKLDGLEIVKHTPVDEGPVLKFDKPWEGNFSTYTTIIKDGDTYKAFYRGVREAGNDGNDAEVTCYAESKDGINWVKPNLRLFEIDGTLDNNVILANAAPLSHNFSPFLDTNPNAKPNQKYKALTGVLTSGLIAYASPDGIHWEKIQEKPVFTKGILDSQNVAFWSESEKKYVCYFRTWTGEGYSGIRSISRTTSSDFINWSEPEQMTFGDTPLEHLYTNQTSPYYRAPHIYIAIGGRFMPGRQVLTEEQAEEFDVNPKYFKDCSDAFFMTSRGGNEYTRTFMEAFIHPGIGLDNWVSRSNYPALNVVQTSPEEMSLYVNQNYAQPTANLNRYSLRIDGFTSISAPYSGGEFETKLFTFTGSKLEVNYSTSAAGEIKFEMQDEHGRAIPGFTMEESRSLIGNEISRTVLWNGKLEKLASKPVRLRIYMKDADLYSIKFTE
ncbi:hypothetical protein J8L85_15310 [Maribacter sp. MMG018]|uniref:hypothetical protein n=1 Tax=Maribacter sp. MMG018 TaxID=2822688 RepID=UPI001B35DD2A|nr:hypothetical protein [Maribacter sp. MMG018]MBQ4915822.1 hypothetical protein [Maribacter sp. MMG018]